jgi:hypothetical protein
MQLLPKMLKEGIKGVRIKLKFRSGKEWCQIGKIITPYPTSIQTSPYTLVGLS